jgi:caffeoyl-CoA O-methyltransferase
MEFLDKKLAEYISAHTDKEPELLKELDRETNEKVLMPRMISGHFQGRVLSMLSKMIKPLNILEIGTYTGYSALCLAEGIQQKGKLITIDINEELEEMVRRYLQRSEVGSRIDYRLGNALNIIPTLNEKFDIVFIDADKENYSKYYDLVFDKINTGGYIIADNVLWSGKVIEEKIKTDKDTQAIMDFNKKVHEDPRVENVLFPIRDGLLIARKKR